MEGHFAPVVVCCVCFEIGATSWVSLCVKWIIKKKLKRLAVHLYRYISFYMPVSLYNSADQPSASTPTSNMKGR